MTCPSRTDDDAIILAALRIAADTRLVDIHPYADGMSASDLLNELERLRDERSEPQAHKENT
jgi:hypothetical protein